MRRMLDQRMIFIVATLLAMMVPALADGMQMMGQVPQKPPGQESWTDQMKSGFSKLTKSMLPEKEKPQKIDELSLSRQVKPSSELHVALAESHAQNGQTQKAIIEYEKALKLDSKHEDTLLKYAHFCDRINQIPKAEELYLKAAKASPRVARVFNHQGLFFVRHKRYAEAAEAFSTAVALEPIEESYRGNLAVVLVDLGQHTEAYKQLRAVQSPDTAYYNLGYLLQERGKTDLAIKHFQVALRKNPNHKEAGIWLAHLRQQQQARPPEMMVTQPVQQEMVQIQTPPQHETAQAVPPQQLNINPKSFEVPQVQPESPQTGSPELNPQRIATRPLPEIVNAPMPSPIALPPQPQPQSVAHEPASNWQPQMPLMATGPVRAQPHYRETVFPPVRQQPNVMPAPATSIQSDSPPLATPSGMVSVQRLPLPSTRRTVNSASDRYITPLPPVDWSDTFKEDR